jgi:hypothetical protein
MKFTLQIRGPERQSIGDKTLHLDSESHIWPNVVRHLPHAHIRVLDSSGGILVLTSVMAALLVSDEAEQAA